MIPQVSLYKLCNILNFAPSKFRQIVGQKMGFWMLAQWALMGSTDASPYGSSPSNQQI